VHVVLAAGGSSGWQAPEQLMAKDGSAVRQSRAMDVFSLGCVMYYCLTAGKHPFGEHYERDTNILRGLCNLAPLHKWPEAYNLVGGVATLGRAGLSCWGVAQEGKPRVCWQDVAATVMDTNKGSKQCDCAWVLLI
jgi:serine/threonine protein kinase